MRNGFHDKAIKDLDFIDKQIVYYENKFFETLERKRRRIIVEELDLYD